MVIYVNNIKQWKILFIYLDCPNIQLDNICINVEKCIYSDSGFCIECEDGYYL